MDFGAIETANEKLVNDFCRDWSLRDAGAMSRYLADDLIYQIAPGQPLIEGFEQFRNRMGPFMQRMESIRWDIVRSHAVGPLVLNERIDHFIAPEGSGAPSMRFHVAGHFLIKDGKIQVWKDWPMPGAKQVVG
jgi:limonene-1,2-epoxide hydrolase